MQKNILFLLLALTFLGCEKEIIPDPAFDEEKVVVEGYIQQDASNPGGFQLPTYVILTRSTSFFSTIDSTKLTNLFIHDADVRVSDGTREVRLKEICLSSLSPSEQQLLSTFLGSSIIGRGVNACVYLDTTLSMTAVQGKSYHLNIKTANKTITSTTTVPTFVGLDSLWYERPSNAANDSVVSVRTKITDPVTLKSYYRYFTKRGYRMEMESQVFDDAIINGTSLPFTIQRAQQVNEDNDVSTFGYFFRGDTVQVRWQCMDKPQYDFWTTLRANRQGTGPFSSFTRIKSNINGGLGIWAGVSYGSYRMIIPRQ